MNEQNKAATKRACFERALDATGVFLHLDPRCAGVVVPPWLVSALKYQLVLQIAHGFPVPIRDLSTSDDGVEVTLSFQTRLFHCVIPWTSVYAMVSGEEVTTWPEDFPPELIAPPEKAPVNQPKRVEKRAKRPTLTLIKGGLS